VALFPFLCRHFSPVGFALFNPQSDSLLLPLSKCLPLFSHHGLRYPALEIRICLHVLTCPLSGRPQACTVDAHILPLGREELVIVSCSYRSPLPFHPFPLCLPPFCHCLASPSSPPGSLLRILRFFRGFIPRPDFFFSFSLSVLFHLHSFLIFFSYSIMLTPLCLFLQVGSFSSFTMRFLLFIPSSSTLFLLPSHDLSGKRPSSAPRYLPL